MVGARVRRVGPVAHGGGGGVPLSIPLAQAASWGRDVAGAKATALGVLAGAGFPVPEGVVLTTAAFAASREHDLLGDDAALPEHVGAELDAIAASLTGGAIAVRSSSVAEDRADTSFAGRYRTVLGVHGPAELRDAVAHCWADDSGTGGDDREAPAPMALLVQRQVAADAAGVAFTADPVTGERGQVLISAVRGLGDTVTDGSADPDRWTVDGEQVHAVHVRDGALTAGQARQVAALARRIEQSAESPQDVEWAFADGRLVVLQARPITALPTPPTAGLPAGRTWERDTERYAEPFTALGASVAPAMVSAGLSRAFHDAGSLITRVEVRAIAGQLYVAVSSPGKPGAPPPPWWALAVLARVNPGLRAACTRARRAGDRRAIQARIDRWRTVQGPALDATAARLRAVELASLDDAGLVRHLRDVRTQAKHAMAVHFELIVPEVLPIYRLVRACRDLLGWDTVEALGLLGGSSPASSAPGRQLRRLARAAGPAERAAVQVAPAGSLLTELARIAPTFAVAFTEWCEQFAFRGISDDPGAPVFWERPPLIEQLVRDAFDRPDQDPATVATTAEIGRARRLLADAAPRRRARFEQALRDARDAHGVRDDVAARTGATFGGLLRCAALEAGARLVARGALGRREDAVQLRFDQLCDAVEGTLGASEVEAQVARASAERAWVRAHPGPDRIGPEFALPDLRALPAAAREMNRALLWSRGSGTAPTPAESTRGHEDALVRGIPSSPGVRTGPVRLVLTSADIDGVRPGDVLVCATADPAWSVLFQVAGALVADHAGPLSHAAIMARENGLPAVLGTGEATQVLRDGQLVTVDGSAGRVTAAPAEEEEGV